MTQKMEGAFQKIRDTTEGWVAKRFNKPISFAITRRLVRTSITPNQITVANLGLALVAALLIADPRYGVRCLGAVLMQVTSILDGCDGEVAKIKGLETRLGAWLDTVADDLANNLFFLGLVIGLWRSFGTPWILTTGMIVIAESLIISFIIYHYLVTETSSGRAQDFRLAWEKPNRDGPQGTYATFLKPFLKRDFFIAIMALAIILDQRLILLVLASLGVTIGFLIYSASFLLRIRRR